MNETIYTFIFLIILNDENRDIHILNKKKMR